MARPSRQSDLQANYEQLNRDHDERSSNDDPYNRQHTPPLPERLRRLPGRRLDIVNPFHVSSIAFYASRRNNRLAAVTIWANASATLLTFATNES